MSADGAATLREQVLDACLILAATGCVREITGHVSARIPGTNEIMLRCRRPNDPGVEFTVLDDIRRLATDGAGWGAGSLREGLRQASSARADRPIRARVKGLGRGAACPGGASLRQRPMAQTRRQ